MIIDGILHVFFGGVMSILSAIPNIPAIPSGIATAGTWIVTIVGQGASFGQFLFSSVLWDAIIGVVAVVWAFEPVYHGIMWVLRKLPFLGIH